MTISYSSIRSIPSPNGYRRRMRATPPVSAAIQFPPAHRDCNRLAPVFNRPASGLAVAVDDQPNHVGALNHGKVIHNCGKAGANV